MLAFLESLEFLEILRLLKLENFITMVRRNLGSATPPSVMALFSLDAIASPSTYPCQSVSGSVGQSVIDSFKLKIAIASPSFASLFVVLQSEINSRH